MKNNCTTGVKEKSQDEISSSPKEQRPGQTSDSIHKIKREMSTPYTAWIPSKQAKNIHYYEIEQALTILLYAVDTPSTRPKSTIISR
jgi:hypothetical protein